MYLKRKHVFLCTYVYSLNWKLDSNLSKLSEVARGHIEEAKIYMFVQRVQYI